MYFDKNKIDPSIALQKFLSERGMSPSIESEGVYGSTPYIIQKYADNQNAKQNWFLFGKTLALQHMVSDGIIIAIITYGKKELDLFNCPLEKGG